MHFRAPEHLKALLENPSAMYANESVPPGDGRYFFLIWTPIHISLDLFSSCSDVGWHPFSPQMSFYLFSLLQRDPSGD